MRQCGREAVWSTDIRIVSSPAIAGGRIHVGSNNNGFYYVGAKK